MKKIILATLMIFSLNSVCFAQLMKSPAKARPAVTKPAQVAKAVPVSSSEISGKVKLVSAANAGNGVISNIVITDNMGKEAILAILPSTVILGKEGKPITLDKLTSNSSVRIKYRESQGSKAAIAVQIVG